MASNAPSDTDPDTGLYSATTTQLVLEILRCREAFLTAQAIKANGADDSELVEPPIPELLAWLDAFVRLQRLIFVSRIFLIVHFIASGV